MAYKVKKYISMATQTYYNTQRQSLHVLWKQSAKEILINKHGLILFQHASFPLQLYPLIRLNYENYMMFYQIAGI